LLTVFFGQAKFTRLMFCCTAYNEKNTKLEVHSVERIYFRQRCFDASKPRVAASTGTQYHVGFSRHNKIPLAVHTLWEKAIRFRHPDYDLDRAQKLISSSMSRHLSTRNISSKSIHAFLVILHIENRQTNERGRAGENIYPLRCQR